MQLSTNFTLAEFVRSRHAVLLDAPILPTEEQVENARALCRYVLQPARDALGPLYVSSGIRNHTVNRAVGGSSSSQHLYQGGDAAADVEALTCSNRDLFRWLICNTSFDQIIWEHGTDDEPDWVHVSHTRGREQRREIRRTRIVWQEGRRVTTYPQLTIAEAMELGGSAGAGG